jgi:hypothetical protein
VPTPTAPVLDNFNRANAKPPSASYSLGPVIFSAGSELAIQSNVLGKDTVAGGAGENNVYYNAANFGSDLEVGVTITSVPTTLNEFVRLYARLINIGTGTTVGYALRLLHDGTGFRAWRCQRRDPPSAFVTIGADQTQAVVVGDKVFFQITGSTLRFYLYSSGSSTWSQIGPDLTDPTYSSPGKIGVGITGFGPIVDDLAVQSLTPAAQTRGTVGMWDLSLRRDGWF